VIGRLKKIYNQEFFNPSWRGLFLNPFYFARRGLYKHTARLIGSLDGKLLDVGCGTKPYKHLCSANEYIGLDISDEKIRKNRHADVYYDGKRIPFDDATFDSVLTNQVLEHVFNPDEFLSEISRVTKSGGMLLISVPFVWDEHEQPYDFARYSSFGLTYLLDKYGYEVVEFTKSNGAVETIFQLINGYIFKITHSKNFYTNLAFTLFLMAPFNLLGVALAKILPYHDDLYLDSIVLAKKVRDV